MTPLGKGFEVSRLVGWLSLAVLVLCLCAARGSRTRMDDDNLYLAYGAQSESAQASALEESLIDRIAAIPKCEESAHRLKLRRRYAHNYEGYADVQWALQRAAAFFVQPGPASIIAGTLAVKVLFFLALTTLLAMAAVRRSNRELEMAVLCTLITLVAMDVAMTWVPAPSRVAIHKPMHAILQVMSSFLVTSASHSYFGTTPRNSALLVFATVMLLKWQGRGTLAVLAMFVMASIHQTYAGIALFLFATTTAVSRPEVFATGRVRLLLIGLGLVYVVREHFFEDFGVWAQIASGLGLSAAALLFFRIVCSAAFAALRRRCLGRWLDREVCLDAAVLAGLVFLITLVSLIGDQLMDDPIARRYVWANLPTRTLSFVRFSVFVAAFWLVWTRVKWHESPRARTWFAAASAVTCLTLSYGLLTRVDLGVWERLGGEINSRLGAPRDPVVLWPKAEEARMYAHLTMVAAGQMEASAADTSIVRDRRIDCVRPGKRRR